MSHFGLRDKVDTAAGVHDPLLGVLEHPCTRSRLRVFDSRGTLGSPSQLEYRLGATCLSLAAILTAGGRVPPALAFAISSLLTTGLIRFPFCVS